MARLQGGRDAVESGFWGQIGRSDGSLFGPIWPSGIFTGHDERMAAASTLAFKATEA